MSQANLKNHFVGYTLQSKANTGRHNITILTGNGLLASVGPDLSMKMFAAREAMNFIKLTAIKSRAGWFGLDK